MCEKHVNKTEINLNVLLLVRQLALQMDALEQYLKIEKMDPAQISEDSVHHKEAKHSELSSSFTDVQGKGKAFIKEATEVSIIKYTHIVYTS